MTLPPERVSEITNCGKRHPDNWPVLSVDFNRAGAPDAVPELTWGELRALLLTAQRVDALTAEVQAKEQEIARLRDEINTRMMAERSILKQLSKIGESNEPSL